MPHRSLLSGLFQTASPARPDGSAAAERARNAAADVEVQLARARLTLEAMWTLLRDKFGVTDEELAERMVELDLEDGVLDGKVRRGPAECGQCGKTIPRKFARCLYCGSDIPLSPF